MIYEIHRLLRAAQYRSYSANYGDSVALLSPNGEQIGDDLPIGRGRLRGEDDPPRLAECQSRMDAAPNGAKLRHRTATAGDRRIWQKRKNEWISLQC